MNFIHGLAIGLLALGLPNQQQQPATSTPGKATDQSLIVIAKLSTPLDAEKAKVGDRVAAKVIAIVPPDPIISIYPWGVYEIPRQPQRQSDIESAERVLPRGSEILGYVTQVQKRSKSNQESRIGFVFDRAQLKDGTLVPFLGYIEKVDQYYTSYEASHTVHEECESHDWEGFCTGRSKIKPDIYNLETVTRHIDESPGILLASTKHNVKLGWSIQIQLRLSQGLIP